jgi:hypothetical protein
MSSTTTSLTRTTLQASWYAIGLGLLFETLQLGVLKLGGAGVPAGAAILADTVQKVSWSYIVCVALAIGTAATRGNPVVTGGLGLIAAPAAFGAARALHKSVAQALSVGVASGGPNPWLMAGIKAVEYAVFGFVIVRLIRRREPRLAPYIRTGLVIGVLFGALLVGLMDRAAPPPGLSAPLLVVRSLNEMLFPAGCAVVLWVTNVLTRRAG